MSRQFGFFPCQVERVDALTPSIRRVTFSGEALADFADPGWDQRIKLVLPAPEGGYSHLPTEGEDWYRDWLSLPDSQRPPIRTYTTRRVTRDATGTRVAVDMVLHGEPNDPQCGPASRWLASAASGREAMLLGPSQAWLDQQEPGAALNGGIDFVPPARTGAYLLGGDETAAPAIARILEDLPGSARGIVVIEVPTSEDTTYLPAHPGFELRVMGRDGAAHGERLIAGVVEAAAQVVPHGTPCEVEEIDVDHELLWEVPSTAKGGAALAATDLYVWLAGEAAAVRTMRRHLVSERGIDRRTVAFMGYWRLGKAEGA